MRLGKEERAMAPAIHRCLSRLRRDLHAGPLAGLKSSGTEELTRHGFKVDYVEIADADTLAMVVSWDGRQPLVGLVAAFLGEVRLIDNLLLHP
jgi:pantoate--beta-alanine ligase